MPMIAAAALTCVEPDGTPFIDGKLKAEGTVSMVIEVKASPIPPTKTSVSTWPPGIGDEVCRAHRYCPLAMVEGSWRKVQEEQLAEELTQYDPFATDTVAAPVSPVTGTGAEVISVEAATRYWSVNVKAAGVVSEAVP